MAAVTIHSGFGAQENKVWFISWLFTLKWQLVFAYLIYLNFSLVVLFGDSQSSTNSSVCSPDRVWLY